MCEMRPSLRETDPDRRLIPCQPRSHASSAITRRQSPSSWIREPASVSWIVASAGRNSNAPSIVRRCPTESSTHDDFLCANRKFQIFRPPLMSTENGSMLPVCSRSIFLEMRLMMSDNYDGMWTKFLQLYRGCCEARRRRGQHRQIIRRSKALGEKYRRRARRKRPAR